MGTAGSGKSTLTSSLSQYLEDQGNEVAILNLDPAAEYLPYTPDIDIRDQVNARQLMRKYKLGPNASMIAAMDLVITRVDELREQISAFEPDYLIVDTPGQMEIFAFRGSGSLLVNRLSTEKSIVLFTIDSNQARTPSGLVSNLLLSLSAQYRFQKSQYNVLNKSDLLDPDLVDDVVSWVENPQQLELSLQSEGLETELNMRIIQIIEAMGSTSVPIPVSSVTRSGLDRLHAILEQALTGGEKPQ